MKRFIYIILLTLVSWYSGRHNGSVSAYKDICIEEITPKDFDSICIEEITPKDFDSFWVVNDACSRPIYCCANTYLDTIKTIFRKPFSKYLLGDYYLGYILCVDSVKSISPFIDIEHDSIIYVYTSFYALEKLYCPYNKNIYYSPIPLDVENDSANNFRYYRTLLRIAKDTTPIIIKVCMMMTRQEFENINNIVSMSHMNYILLSVYTDDIKDSILFCPQFFFEHYNKNVLVSHRQAAKIQLSKYMHFFYDLYKKDPPSNLLHQ